jgi:hypothetical protein
MLALYKGFNDVQSVSRSLAVHTEFACVQGQKTLMGRGYYQRNYFRILILKTLKFGTQFRWCL